MVVSRMYLIRDPTGMISEQDEKNVILNLSKGGSIVSDPFNDPEYIEMLKKKAEELKK